MFGQDFEPEKNKQTDDIFSAVGRIFTALLLAPLTAFGYSFIRALFFWIGFNWTNVWISSVIGVEVPKIPLIVAWGFLIVLTSVKSK